MGEDWKSAMLGVTRLKHLFRKKAHDEQEAGELVSANAIGVYDLGTASTPLLALDKASIVLDDSAS